MKKTGDEITAKIQEIWHYLRSQTGQYPHAKKVRYAFKRAHPEADCPGLRKVQDIVKPLRDADEALPKEVKDLDIPWTMDNLAKYPILPEALPAVLRVAKYCAVNGDAFSVREAKWVVTLHNVFTNVSDLLYWARLYTNHERIGHDFTNINAALTMNTWELATATWMGTRAKPVNFSPRMTMRGSESPAHMGDTDAQVAAEEEELKWEKEENVDVLPLQPLIGSNLTEEAAWVYVHWLKYLRKGSKWKSLSNEKLVEIRVRLRKWILNHPWNCDYEWLPYTPPQSDQCKFGHAFEDIIADPAFAPWEILKEAGYGESGQSLKTKKTSNKEN